MLYPHGSQELKREGEAVPAVVDPVDEHLHVHDRALGLQAPGQLLVRQLLALAQLLDERAGAQVVKRSHFSGRPYIVFHLNAWYDQRFRFARRKSNLMYV